MKNLLILLVLVIIASCGPNNIDSSPNVNTLEKIKSEKKVKVGYIVFPPCINKNSDNSLSGHFIETMNWIAKQTNWEVEYIESSWDTYIAGLKSKKFDICIAPTFITINRSLEVSFTEPFFYAGNSAIVRKGENRFTDIQSIDKEGVTIAVTQGEAGEEFARNNFKKATILSIQASDQSLTFQSVISKRADIALGDAYATKNFSIANPAVLDLYASNPYNITPVSWTVRPEDIQLLNFLNNSIKFLDTSGKLLEFEKKENAHWLHIRKDFIIQ